MSDSGTSSAVDECDFHLSSLTIGEFRQAIETNNRQLQMIQCSCRYGRKQIDCLIWNASTGRVMPNDMPLEAFLNVQINVDNQTRRAERRRSGSPVLNNKAFTLQAIVTDANVLKQLLIEYKPASGFVYTRR